MSSLLEGAINQFLAENPDYYNDYNNFSAYLNSLSPSISLYNDISIRGIGTKTVIDSLKYHVLQGTFHKKTVATKYCITIQELFHFLHRTNPTEWGGPFIGELGAPLKDKSSYKRKYRDFISDCDSLREKEQLDAISDAAVTDLINFCNESIENVLDLSDVAPTRISFKNMASALCVKLMLFSGCAYRVVRQLHLSDYNEDIGWIAINGYEVILPFIMKQQFRLYKQYRTMNKLGISENYLFCDLDGYQWGEGTSDSNVPSFLDSRMKQTDLTSIIKYGIIQMMKLNINDNALMQLTGANKGVIEHCRLACGADFWHAHLNGVLMRTNLYQQEYEDYCSMLRT